MRAPRVLILGSISIFFLACRSEPESPISAAEDISPPARVRNLAARAGGDSTLVFTWTAPGDDGMTGRAERYDLRIAPTPMTPAAWQGALPLPCPQPPLAAGQPETLRVPVRLQEGPCWIGLNTVDDAGNWSGLSNTVETQLGPSHWWTGFASDNLEMGTAAAITLFEGDLIAGGSLYLDGTEESNYTCLARWDGARWSPMDGGLTAWIQSLATYRDALIAGGFILSPDGVEACNIVSWDGATWRSLGSGVDEAVYALTVFRDRLIAAGDFSHAGDSLASHIAAWDGGRWQPLGAGLDGTVYALLVHQDRLLAGGAFHRAGDVSADGIASWDGERWSPIGLGPGGMIVRSLAVSNGVLYAGGHSELSADNIPGVARYDGIAWTNLPDTESLIALAMADFNGTLIVGGGPSDYWSHGRRVLQWKDDAWTTLGTPNGYARAILTQGNSIYVGGDFYEMGPVSGPIARWDE